MRKRSIVFIFTIPMVLAFATRAIAADPHIGTWKMNAAKSKSSSKSDTVRFELLDNGIKLVGDYVDAEGKAYHEEMTAKYDGKDYPYHGGPYADTMSFKRIDANTFDQVIKKGGKVVATAREVFSQDGKTFIRTTKAKDEKGQEVIVDVGVYEKQ